MVVSKRGSHQKTIMKIKKNMKENLEKWRMVSSLKNYEQKVKH